MNSHEYLRTVLELQAMNRYPRGYKRMQSHKWAFMWNTFYQGLLPSADPWNSAGWFFEFGQLVKALARGKRVYSKRRKK